MGYSGNRGLGNVLTDIATDRKDSNLPREADVEGPPDDTGEPRSLPAVGACYGMQDMVASIHLGRFSEFPCGGLRTRLPCAFAQAWQKGRREGRDRGLKCWFRRLFQNFVPLACSLSTTLPDRNGQNLAHTAVGMRDGQVPLLATRVGQEQGPVDHVGAFAHRLAKRRDARSDA